MCTHSMEFDSFYRAGIYGRPCKWDPHEKGIEIKPEVLLDNEWNPLELHDVNFFRFYSLIKKNIDIM